MFSVCGDWEAEVKRRVCRLLSGLCATVRAVPIMRSATETGASWNSLESAVNGQQALVRF